MKSKSDDIRNHSCELCPEEFESSEDLLLHLSQHDITLDWRRFFSEWIGYTNGDMFIHLMEDGILPTHPGYKARIHAWLESNILEEKPHGWLEDYSSYFLNYTLALWQNKKIILHNHEGKIHYLSNDGFFNKIIDTLDHSTSKCTAGKYIYYLLV